MSAAAAAGGGEEDCEQEGEEARGFDDGLAGTTGSSGEEHQQASDYESVGGDGSRAVASEAKTAGGGA